jgi:hypothetical protein
VQHIIIKFDKKIKPFQGLQRFFIQQTVKLSCHVPSKAFCNKTGVKEFPNTSIPPNIHLNKDDIGK